MSDDPKGDQARAIIAALQSILDKLPKSEPEEAEAEEAALEPVKDRTHELFVRGLDQVSLASLFTSIRIIHSLYNKGK